VDYAASVESVSRDDRHRFSKPAVNEIVLLDGLGVEGDAHCGVTTQHRYLKKRDPTLPNLCQVHLLPAELYDDLTEAGWTVDAGSLGENVTTRGIDLMSLSTGTLVRLGPDAVVEITGRRSPCSQINKFEPGMLKAVFGPDATGRSASRAGIMGIVVSGGTVRPGDEVSFTVPAGPFRELAPV
jgi:MOSC domain-containing protein YiiM